LSDLSIIVGGDDTTLDSEAMRSLPRHALTHSDGRRLLVYGELRGSLEEEGPGAAGDGAEIHVETGLGLFLDDVAPEDPSRRLARLAVRAEPIELDSLFAVTQPDAAMLS
jgi:hypothetical protein